MSQNRPRSSRESRKRDSILYSTKFHRISYYIKNPCLCFHKQGRKIRGSTLVAVFLSLQATQILPANKTTATSFAHNGSLRAVLKPLRDGLHLLWTQPLAAPYLPLYTCQQGRFSLLSATDYCSLQRFVISLLRTYAIIIVLCVDFVKFFIKNFCLFFTQCIGCQSFKLLASIPKAIQKLG